MDLLAPVSRHLVAPLHGLKERSPHLRYARFYDATQWWPPERLYAYRWARLKQVLHYAFEHSEFHRRRFRAIGVEPADIRDPDDLRRLPRLSKEEVRDQWDQILVPAAINAGHITKETSGSTGVPLRITWEAAAAAHKRALTIRHNRWAGYDVGDPVGLIWGDIEAPRALRSRLRRALLDRFVVLDSQHLTAQAMESFAESIRRARIRCLLAQAQPLSLFAEFVHEKGLDDLPIETVIPTGMMLHARQRQFMEKVLSWRVFDRYGAEETSVIASECEAHEGLHICAEGLWLEVVRGDRAAAPGKEGELLVTDLVNRALPLIRYEIGDVVVPSAADCPCGRTLPRFERVSGRVADCITSPEGFVVSGIAITDHITRIPGIQQLQVVQDMLDHLQFRIVRSRAWSQTSMDLLGELVGRMFGERMRFECLFVPEIPPEPGGKYRFSISSVTHGIV